MTDMDWAKAFYGDMGFIAIITDREGNSIGLHSWI